jgi:Domain of unknown function (DUF4337)
MAEIEIHHEHAHEADPFGRRVGIAVGIIGIFLAAVTIASHREHTAAVVHKTEANDQWAFYQAKKIRGHMVEIAAEELTLLSSDEQKVAAATAKFRQEKERYDKDSEDIKRDAEAKEHLTEVSESRALRFDLGEGFLELGMVLSSLYFLSKRKLFPGMGFTAAILGLVFGASGLLV